MISPFLYLQQVRAEIRKISWPSKRETLVSFVIVLLIVIFFAILLSLFNLFSIYVVEVLINLPEYYYELKAYLFP